MTLYLALTDATTGEKVAQIADRQKGRDYGRLQWTNGVTNKSDADRALQYWADRLRSGLDQLMRP